MKIKTSELKGAALDWAVAKAEGFPDGRDVSVLDYGPDDSCDMVPNYSYSTSWAQGGPIIEREKIDTWFNGEYWHASYGIVVRGLDGSTPIIAAMRCYVASKLGDKIEIPDELTKEI